MRIGAIVFVTALLLALPALAGPFEVCGPDVDSDGICPTLDNCLLKYNPGQDDTDFDGCGNACDPDFNQDGVVGAADFSRLAVAFGNTVPPASPNIDMAPQPLDGVIGAADFSNLAVNFGLVPGPSGTTSGTIACP